MKTKLLNLALIFISLWSYGQSCGTLMTPLSIEDRANESTTILEGMVINSQSYWDTNQHNIYTVHTLDVYTHMLNNNSTAIQVVTMGGQVGDILQETSSEAHLRPGDIGTFFLKNFTGPLNLPGALYELVGAAQGVITYDRFSNKASDVFNQYQSVENELYGLLQNATGQAFQVVQMRPTIENEVNPMATPVIASFSPTTAAAGTQTILTIDGSDFGDAIGTVSFPDANTGGAIFAPTLASEIMLWSDTQIQVEIPWFAGTGNVVVTTITSETAVSSSNLTIDYSHVNATTSTTAYPSTVADDSGNGGFAFTYHTEFDTSPAKTYFEAAFELWNCESNINFELGSTTSTDVTAQDGINIVRFDNGNELPSGTLGRVTTWTGVCGTKGLVNEMDITWNDGINWYYGPGLPSVTQFDFKSVALHELGHTHRLGHVINSSSVMHFSIGPGQNRYTLSQNEIDGAAYTMGVFTAANSCAATPMSEGFYCCDPILINSQPSDLNVAINAPGMFDVMAENYETVQWQVSTDSGSSWSDLTEGGNYTGTTNLSLMITNALETFNGYQYRANFTNICNETLASQAAVLNVIQYTYVPDDNFEAALSAYDDIPNDDYVPTNNINTITNLDVGNEDIANMEGIEAFTALEVLDARGNPFTSITLTANTQLVELNLKSTGISTVNLQLNTQLEILNLESTDLSALNLQFNTDLKDLNISDGSIASLDLSNNTALEQIDLDSAGVSELIFGTNNYPNFTYLYVAGCNLIELDLSKLTNIESVYVWDNNLESLNIKNGNNTAIINFEADNNPNLNCILVDDEVYSTNNWTQIDPQTSFSDTSCGYTLISDPAFEAALGALGYDDIPNDGQVPTWLIDSVTTLDVEDSGIEDLDGIEDFTALINLNCSRNSLEDLNLQGSPDLEVLNCSRNLLESINVANNQDLRELNCERNFSLSAINVLSNLDLERLDAENTGISTINISNNELLTFLDIRFNNPINQLDLSGNPNLETLLCNNTNVPSLDLSNKGALRVVHAHVNNSLTEIILTNTSSLEQLLLQDTQVNSFDISDCLALRDINVNDTRVTELNLGANGALETVNVSDNNDLTSLNVRNGNNIAITSFNATNTPNLTCIGVDDVAYSTTNWTNVDAGANFSNVCAYTAIPDANFEARLGVLGHDDIANDGQAPTAAISLVTNLDLRNQGISDLTGLQAFTNLEDLNVRENGLDSLNITNNTKLKILRAQDNNLTEIDFSNNADLINLGLARNAMISIDVSANEALRELYLAVNNLTSLDLSANPNIQIVGVNHNNLQNFNLQNGNNTNITTLSVSGGNPNLACILVDDVAYANANFTTIDSQTFFSETDCTLTYTAIPDPVFEAELSAYDNFPNDGQIPTQRIQTVTVVDVRNTGVSDLTGIQDFVALEVLDFIDNAVDSVDVSNAPNLRRLRLRNNNVSTIDLSNNPNLEHLLMENNGVEHIDLSNNLAIEELYLGGNQIRDLDLSSHSVLRILGVNTNNLVNLNVQNGNNTNMTIFVAGNNPNLNCIVVDDVPYAQANFTSVDPQVSFNAIGCTQYTLIPDPNFETALSTYDDISADGRVPTANIEVLQTLAIESANISDLSGIEDFTALEEIYATGNTISEADFSDNLNLMDIDLEGNPIDDLNIASNMQLLDLRLSGSLLTTLNVNNNGNLQTLRIRNSSLTELDVSGLPNLQSLWLNNNDLTALNLKNGNNTNINSLFFDVRNNPNLTCIFVDDATYSTTNWTNVDPTTFFRDGDYCDYTLIPDTNFETRLGQLGYDDVSDDGQVPTDLIINVESLNLNNRGIDELTGIEDFTALKTLIAINNNLEALDVSHNTSLETLTVPENELSTLVLGEIELISLAASDNQLTALDLSPNTTLEEIDLANNSLDSLNISGLNALVFLNLNHNDFETLDLSGGTSVQELLLNDNTSLTDLNLSNNPSLRDAYLRRNTLLTALTFGNNPTLRQLHITESGLAELDLSPLSALREIYASDTALEALDLSSNSNFDELVLENTPISFLNIKNGNNTDISDFEFRLSNSPNLFCVLVDDASYSSTIWTNVDPQVSFSDTYCRYTAIPDAAFEAALENLGYDDISGDGQVPTALIEVVTFLEIHSDPVASISGIQDFAALEELIISFTQVGSVNLLANSNLIKLDIVNSPVTSINLLNNTLLEDLIIEDTNASIAMLDLTNNTALKNIDVSNAGLQDIVLPQLPSLEIFFLPSNGLTASIDLSASVLLQRVALQNNDITDLNIKNGNNTNLLSILLTNNPNLTCIAVDDATYSTANWTNIDAQTNFTDNYCRYTQIPDANFEARLSALGYDDISGDGQVPTALIENITSIDVRLEGIANFAGIEDFVNLEVLLAQGNYNTSINIRTLEALTHLDLKGCSDMATIDLEFNTALEILDVSQTDLSVLDISTNAALQEVYASGASGNGTLSSITFGSNTQLRKLDLNNNLLTSLNLSALTALEELNIANNQLTSLNIKNGNNTAIVDFQASNNPNLTCIAVDDVAYSTANWTDIDAQTSFTEDYCRYTAIPDAVFETALENLGYDDISGDGQVPTALIENVTSLNVQDQFPIKIEDLSGIEAFKALEALDVNANNISSLNLTANTNLISLSCYSSGIQFLNVDGLSQLEEINCGANSLLVSLNLTTNSNLKKLECDDTEIVSLDLSGSPLLTYLNCNFNTALSELNVKNGNNTNVTFFDTRSTNSLTCILVDNVAYSTANWTNIGSNNSFNEISCCDQAATTITCPSDITVNCGDVVTFTVPSFTSECSVAAGAPTSIDGYTLFGTFGSSTYFISDTTDTPVNQFAFANANNYNILTIGSAEENNYIRTRADSLGIGSLLIGYNDLAVEDTFEWQSGEPFTYDNWNYNEPNDSGQGEDYTQQLANGFWNDTNGSSSSRLIIEFVDYGNGPVQVSGLPSGSDFPVGVTTNTYVVEDIFGEVFSCAFEVNVTDTQAPIVTCGNLIVDMDPGACGANITVPTPAISDTCANDFIIDSGPVDYRFQNSGLQDTTAILRGVTTAQSDVTLEVSFRGDHDNGTEAFDLRGPDNLQVVQLNSSNQCELRTTTLIISQTEWNNWVNTYGTDLTFTLQADANVNDNCNRSFYQIKVLSSGDAALTNDYNGTSNASGFYPVGTTLVTWTVTDLGGNTATCSQTITVNDTVDPTMTCTADIVVNNDPGTCSALVTVPLPTINDNCSQLQKVGPITNYNFDGNDDLIDTPTTLSNVSPSQGDVALDIYFRGDFGGDLETFALNGPDGNLLFSEDGPSETDCAPTTRSLIIPQNTWNTWVNDFGTNLVFTLLGDPEVNPNISDCIDMLQLTATYDTLSLTNDYNGTADASDTYPIGTTTVTWTVTDSSGNTNTCSFDVTVDDVNDSCGTVSVAAKVYLQGAALNPNTGEASLMRDDLRVSGLIPTTSPYADGLSCDSSVFNTTGADAIVDWIWIELRDAANSTVVSHSRSALLQRDGDVVDVDGTSALDFLTIDDTYYVALNHRSHLGIMTNNAITFASGSAENVDFTFLGDSFTHGTNAQTTFGLPIETYGMWAGNVSGDNTVKYQGGSNDTTSIKDEVLNDSGNSSSSNLFTFTAYNNGDVDMDGVVQYQGSGNDSNVVKDTVLSHPDNQSSPSNLFIITEQLPELLIERQLNKIFNLSLIKN